MKVRFFPSAVSVVLFAACAGFASVLHVDVNSTNPVPPYTNWATAAAVIQEAVDAAAPGDEILVTNGVYATGGKAVFGLMTNRVAVDKPLTLRSVNGPKLTIISGESSPNASNGTGAIRCVFLASNAILNGFTLTEGCTLTTGDSLREQSGGGAWCETGSTVRNSVIASNSANRYGGGIYGGEAYNCEIVRNLAADGGGAYGSMIYNCTVVTNRVTSRSSGAGTALCTNYNTIVHYNYYSSLANHSQSAFFWSCTTPLPIGGVGNITNLPKFVDMDAGIYRLQCGSPCIDAGTNLISLIADDLRAHIRPADGDGDGLARFDMGAHERNSAYDAQDIGIRAAFTNFALHFPVSFTAQLDGCLSNFWWDFGDGSTVTNQHTVVHAWTAPGSYPVTLTAQFAVSGVSGVTTATVGVVNATYYVDANNPAPAYPFDSWATAATNIQDAVDAGSTLGRTVLVTNGVYKHGGIALFGTMTNRVALTNGVRLQSVNGPDHTTIEGAQSSMGGNGDGAVRCTYVDQLSVVSGFTLTNGHTQASVAVNPQLHDGGGIWSEASGLITNCIVVGNSCHSRGAGARGGRLYDCVLAGNTAYEGAGAIYASLFDCVLRDNVAVWAGGGGAAWSTLYGCTVAGNSTPSPAGGGTGGVDGCKLYNSIVYGNGGGNWGGGAGLSTFESCCTTPLPAGLGSIALDPLFIDLAGRNLNLQPTSPCINAGNNAYVACGMDLNGNPRVKGGTVDTGAFEFQSPQSAISYAWLQQYGFPIDGSADNADADNDKATNWQEWKAWTNPNDELSVLRLLTPQRGTNGAVVTWQSVIGQIYLLQRATRLGDSFVLLRGSIVGQAGTTSYTDTTATNEGAFFFRVGVP